MTNITCYRHKIASMRLLNDNDIGVQVNTKEEDHLWSISDVIYKTSGGGDTSHTNVIWVQNPWTQLTNTEKGTDMPAATIGSTQHPNNEECGIRDIVQKFPYVAMDTEFPGVVARPIGEFRSTADYQYQLLRCNVDLLRIIQLGLTFLDENGKTPGGSYTTWQFNFKFNLSEDMYAQDSIELLQNSGIQFKKHEEEGIEPLDFAELLMTSGIVLMDNIKWLSFHSGYDFGYLIKLLTDNNLPQDESEFLNCLNYIFPPFMM
ncbi:ccr4-not transcription complex subunit [Holotrichia oblita]|uniref:Ccr4-not transcription complex subunit n=1 Tax=Holotrichia oblita TaxID=644536 RepID=A0ACB9TAF1_HOLOL|nr:ccr4-not transcription complex subunit [Holotrichia oblita]